MVPVKKKIIAAKAPEAAEPQKRRPRNTELNSSKKPLTGKISTAGRNPFVRKLNCSKLVGSTFDGKTYDEARKLLMADELGYEQLWDYFDEYMPKIGQEIGKNVDMQYGETADLFFNTMAECATEAEFVKEVQDKLQEYRDLWLDDGNSVNSTTDQSMNCSEELNCDASGISGAQDLLQKFVEDAASKFHTNLTLEWKPYSWKWSPEKKEIQYVIQEHTENSDGDYTMSEITGHPSAVKEFVNSARTFIQETVIPYLVDNAPEVTRIDGLFNDGISYLNLGDFNTDAPDVDNSDYDEELDSSKNQSMNCSEDSDEVNPSEKDGASVNCSEGESGTIYTESGNEVAITDIKIVQNPQTNALALFVPENGDDEIPEGFTVIGDVIATAAGEPAIEENAETGDDSLNSSKKPPMNRAQRRAAQRGARRPKKR